MVHRITRPTVNKSAQLRWRFCKIGQMEMGKNWNTFKFDLYCKLCNPKSLSLIILKYQGYKKGVLFHNFWLALTSIGLLQNSMQMYQLNRTVIIVDNISRWTSVANLLCRSSREIHLSCVTYSGVNFPSSFYLHWFPQSCWGE